MNVSDTIFRKEFNSIGKLTCLSIIAIFIAFTTTLQTASGIIFFTIITEGAIFGIPQLLYRK